MNVMLAGKAPDDLSKLTFPVLVSPKLDGVRAIVKDGVVLSRSLKPIPNAFVQERFGRPEFHGLDGELILGEANDPDVFRKTSSAVMSKSGEPDVKLHVFDVFNCDDAFHARLKLAEFVCEESEHLVFVEHCVSSHDAAVSAVEAAYLLQGYEGAMIRSPSGPYKQGRSTTREGYLLKLKRFEESEAVVLRVVELMHNENEAFTDERGKTKRSTAADGLVPGGVMGMLEVRDLKTGIEFGIGSGFTAADRKAMFDDQPIERIVKYSYFPTGSKEKPRFPVFRGFRDPIDL